MQRKTILNLLATASLLLLILPAAASTRGAFVATTCEATYANGGLYCMNAPHVILSPNPNLLSQAQILYLAVYFPLPASCNTANASTCLPETLPSGYMPQCNPCFHGDGLNAFPYHDHIVEGAPGSGTSGTAGDYMGPWVVILVIYKPSFSNSTSFTPFKSVPAVQAGELAGDFQVINPTASNPFEINTGVVLICPLIQSNK